MPLQIPVPDNKAFFDLSVELDGTDYILSFRYNQREKRFYADMSLPDDTRLATGAAVVCNWPLFLRIKGHSLAPLGSLMVAPQSDNDAPPDIGELGPGKRCELWYYTAAEIAGLG